MPVLPGALGAVPGLGAGQAFSDDAGVGAPRHDCPGLFQFSDIRTGRLAILDSNGRLLGEEAGVIRSTYTFDTLNDGEPGGVVIGEFQESLHGRFDNLDFIRVALAP